MTIKLSHLVVINFLWERQSSFFLFSSFSSLFLFLAENSTNEMKTIEQENKSLSHRRRLTSSSLLSGLFHLFRSSVYRFFFSSLAFENFYAKVEPFIYPFQKGYNKNF